MADNLKIVFVRHGEKPDVGDNLTCRGFNRSIQLPKVLFEKFGAPDYSYIPSVGNGKSTDQSRMFQTISPFAIKYNLTIDSQYAETDAAGVAADLEQKNGTVLLVWEHKNIAPIVAALGVNDPDLKWHDLDFDSIWIVTFENGVATLTKDAEGIDPGMDCPF